MNYVQEVTLFYDWLELHTLPPSAINLWYALMHIQQKAGGAETFSVAESVLAIKTGLTDRTVRKARKELKEKGRIDYISRKGKAPTYWIIPFKEWNQSSEPPQSKEGEANNPISVEKNTAVCTENDIEAEQTSEKNAEVCSIDDESSETISADCSTLVRQQQTDNQTHATWSDLMDTWRVVFGFGIRANHVQMLHTYMEHDQMSQSLILEAIERVKQATKPVLNYLWKILSNWANLRIQTIHDLVQHEKKRVHNRQSVHPKRQMIQGRDIPRGFHLDLTEGEDWT